MNRGIIIVISLIAVFALSACSDDRRAVSKLPMIMGAQGYTGPWELKTSNDEPITFYGKQVYITVGSSSYLEMEVLS